MLVDEMASRLVAYRRTGLEKELHSTLIPLIIDLVAVTVSGAATATSNRLRRAVEISDGDGRCTVIGTPFRASAKDAALANGTSAHAEDFDDFNEAFGGHPTVAVLPALLVLAEARGKSGADVIRAYVAGVEAESRLADAVHFHHYEKGWHPTSTLGVFGAAAGAADLLDLPAKETATALSIAASLASGIKSNFGADTKPLHAGHCNQSGLMAALLAEQGFTAGDSTLEGPQGFFEVYNGAGNYEVERLLTDWFDVPKIIDPGVSIKQFPCCGSTHAAIYAAFELHNAGCPAPSDIERVQVQMHPRRLPHTDTPNPRTPLDAKFSVQYVTARALATGRIGSADFAPGAYDQGEIAALTQRVSAGPSEVYAARSDRGFAAQVTVIDKQGHSVTHEYLKPPGRGPGNPMTDAELKLKFDDCASQALTGAGGKSAFQMLTQFEALDDLRPLHAALCDVKAA